jgi:hypothetical protein
MADHYPWNDRSSPEWSMIMTFLELARERVNSHPQRLPFAQREGRVVLSWLRGLTGPQQQIKERDK